MPLCKDDARQPFEAVTRRIDPHATLLRAWPLKGGVSAQVTVIEMARHDGQSQKMIVRQHGEVDRQQNPHIAADEFRRLQLLHAAGLAVPTPYHLDQSGTIFAAPYLVIEYIDGETDFAPTDLDDYLHQLASFLARLHTLDITAHDVACLPHQAQRLNAKLAQRPRQTDDTLDEGRIRDALEAVWPLPRRNPSVVLHGDFWPGNVLWKGGEIAAVIDWEDAAVGDPLVDLGNSRLEILWAYGREAMHAFTRQYLALHPIDMVHLPDWDLYAALRPAGKLAGWGLDRQTEHHMRHEHRWFVGQALEQLNPI